MGNSVAVDPVGNVYTTGSFMKTFDCDPGPRYLI
ncbi:MAG: SBBP repeat-containing protein [Bacteroidetes bacterium]|nr:SBBP repeat-containing protein [Bacteroidota bacterium]